MSPRSCTAQRITQYVIEMPQRHVIDQWKSSLCTSYCLQGVASNAKVNPRRQLLHGHSHEKPKPLYPAVTLAGRSPAEIVGSNPTGGMDICLL